MTARFATLTFERSVAAPPATLWQAWTAPAARAVWSSPGPGITVEFLETATAPGGRERSVCRAPGAPDILCEGGWLVMQADDTGWRTIGHEMVQSDGNVLSAALVTAEAAGTTPGQSSLRVTVQLADLAGGMEAGYREGFGGGLDNLAGVAGRMMVIRRAIRAPRDMLWRAWWNAESLPRWWGPDGFTCRTARIDLRAGGEWVFDMIASDGTVFPNHHRYGEVVEGARLSYTLHWGENGPKHADAWASFEERAGITEVTLGMIFASAEECANARAFGAEALGLQTLGKLARAAGAE